MGLFVLSSFFCSGSKSHPFKIELIDAGKIVKSSTDELFLEYSFVEFDIYLKWYILGDILILSKILIKCKILQENSNAKGKRKASIKEF